jgi:hypothetical protein
MKMAAARTNTVVKGDFFIKIGGNIHFNNQCRQDLFKCLCQCPRRALFLEKDDVNSPPQKRTNAVSFKSHVALW